MVHLIIGGSGSGKSAYAESRAAEAAPVRYYIATMEPFGEEGKRRIEKHRAMRAGKGFQTIECFHHLEQVRLEQAGYCAVLLECISNLTANEQFSVGGSDEAIIARIRNGVRSLREQSRHLFLVTGDVFADSIRYEEETERYLRLLGRVNQELAQTADTVTEVVYGIPVPILKKQNRWIENERKAGLA